MVTGIMGGGVMRPGRLDEEQLLGSEPDAYGGPQPGTTEHMHLDWIVNDPRATVCQEAFPPGAVVSWAFWHSEVHIVLKGEAEVTYTQAPNHRKVVTRTFGPGDTYLIPDGARLRTRVTSDEPYVHIGVIMPRVWHSKEERTDSYE